MITSKLEECNNRIALLEHKNTELTTNCILAKSKKKDKDNENETKRKQKEADKLLEKISAPRTVKNEIRKSLKKLQWNIDTLWRNLDTSVKDDRLNIGEFKKMNKVLGVDISNNNYNSTFDSLMESDGRVPFVKFKNWLEK